MLNPEKPGNKAILNDLGVKALAYLGDAVFELIAVSYTHLDVYKRQVCHRNLVRNTVHYLRTGGNAFLLSVFKSEKIASCRRSDACDNEFADNYADDAGKP